MSLGTRNLRRAWRRWPTGNLHEIHSLRCSMDARRRNVTESAAYGPSDTMSKRSLVRFLRIEHALEVQDEDVRLHPEKEV